MTKVVTGKDAKKDCSKRNCLYQLWCMSCEQRDLEKLKEASESEEEFKEKKEKLRLFKYIGESARSGFERGFEHLNKLATLSSDSCLLRHMVSHHEGEDMEEVKFGMKILKYARSSFERQISEAVTIQQEQDSHEILNSRAEYNSCSLPRLTTRMGDEEMESWERTLRKEKEEDDWFEEKIRELRKARNKARLHTGQEIQPNKRRKVGEDTRISIRTVWEESPEIRDTPGDVEGNNDTDKDTDIDWDRVILEYSEKIREDNINKMKEASVNEERTAGWELFGVCREYLEKKEDNWIKEKRKREKEKLKVERMEEATRQKTLRKEKYLEKKLNEEVTPEERKKEMEKEMKHKKEKERRTSLQKMKKVLWKLGRIEILSRLSGIIS